MDSGSSIISRYRARLYHYTSIHKRCLHFSVYRTGFNLMYGWYCTYLLLNTFQRFQNDLKCGMYPMRSRPLTMLFHYLISCVLLSTILLIVTVLIPIALSIFDAPDWGVILSSYLGIILVSLLTYLV